MRRGWILLLSGLSIVSCSAGPSGGQAGPINGATRSVAAQRIVPIRLPDGASPRSLLHDDKTNQLWIAEAGAIGRIDPQGQAQHTHVSGSVIQLAVAPNGAVWFTGFQQVGRLDPSGAVSQWTTTPGPVADVGLPEALTVGPDGGIWFTDESVPPNISRIDASGQITQHPIPSKDGGFDLSGITTGSDGALWFTEEPIGSGPVNAIGRLATTGHYKRWPLPHPYAHPARVTTASDGAVWFTQGAGSVGRITADGRLSEHRLPSGQRPFDIDAAPDGSVWFTYKTGIGRVTPSGAISLTPIPDAVFLSGIAVSPAGTVYVADVQTDTVWRVEK